MPWSGEPAVLVTRPVMCEAGARTASLAADGAAGRDDDVRGRLDVRLVVPELLDVVAAGGAVAEPDPVGAGLEAAHVVVARTVGGRVTDLLPETVSQLVGGDRDALDCGVDSVGEVSGDVCGGGQDRVLAPNGAAGADDDVRGRLDVRLVVPELLDVAAASGAVAEPDPVGAGGRGAQVVAAVGVRGRARDGAPVPPIGRVDPLVRGGGDTGDTGAGSVGDHAGDM